MATTTTTKKKLVYKQDSDGVFRLKREHSSPTLDKPYRSVADCANELIDCAYTITDAPAAPTLQGAPAPSPTHPAKKNKFRARAAPGGDRQRRAPRVTGHPLCASPDVDPRSPHDSVAQGPLALDVGPDGTLPRSQLHWRRGACRGAPPHVAVDL